MSKQLYHNTMKLARLMYRRDRIRIPIWIIAITFMTLIVAPAFGGLYPTIQDRQIMAETMRNPAMIAMVGPGYGLDDYHVGAMMAHQMLLFTALAVAIMSILFVARHTRDDEEEGRIEMIRSLPAGRLSTVNAAVIVSCIVNVVLALIVGIGLYVLGLESMGLNGSLLYGAVLGVTGIFFTVVTALFAQLSSTNRGAMGLSFAVLGFAYLIRAIGDVSSEALAMTSPLGWILRTQVYVNNYWWPIFLTVGVSFLIGAIALYLNSVRDLGAGFIPAKPGRKFASRFLQSPLGLGLRLQRTSIIAWAVGMFLLGSSYGSVMGDLEGFLETNEMMKQLLSNTVGISLAQQFITMIMSVLAMVSTIPALMMMLKLRGEEKRNRTEHIIARAVSRSKTMGSYLIISYVIGFFMLLFAAIGIGSSAAAVMSDPIQLNTVLQAALAYLPAMWILTGLAILLIGCFPQGTILTWLYLGYSFFTVYFGGLLQFPEWLAKLSPFGNVPKIPVEDMNYPKLLVLTVIAVVLTVIGFVGYNKRDIQG